MNWDARYRLAPGIKKRRESFGGLLYDVARGRLYVVRSSLLMHFLNVEGNETLAEIAHRLCLSPPTAEKIARALQEMERRGIVIAG